ncbi:M1 family metallopeptidase [Nafulsella turpanensis]|uniref:M1 family metallopeptidase n=1 Tax=Nafulsella turpanensis TaxID=1265690 RepID=UPI00034B3CDA|nr:M1 family metallopeptidase [Nafulsella turpanensis]
MTDRKLLNFSFLGLLCLLFACKSTEPALVPDKGVVVQPATPPDTALLAQPEVVSYADYREAKTLLHDLVHTRLAVRFDWEKQYLHGKATLELKPYFYPQSQLVLDAKGFDIHQVQLLKGTGKVPLDYTYDGEYLTIALDKEYNRSENYFVEIDYTAKPNELEAKGSEAITDAKGLYFINPLGGEEGKPRQIWTQGETEASSAWFPTIDSPNQRTTQEMFITVDNQFETLSNGKLVSSTLLNDSTRTDYWRMEKSHAPYLFMMAIGDFAVVDDEWNGMEVDYYVEPAYEKYAKAIFGNTPEMLTFFSEKLGYPYPWSKYSQVVVRDFVSGAMENTTASTFMEALQVDDRELLDDNWDYIIAHELFHHWFGDLVTAESWSNLPLNEAFATYSEYLWSEYKYGEAAAAHTLMEEAASYFAEAENKQVDLIRFYYDDKEDMFDNHSYAKGGRILHMLRSYVGDEAFFASLQHYLKSNDFEPVEVHELRLAFEEITGEDLNWFFNQWFLDSGHPVLRVEDSYEEGVLKLKVWQEQDLETTPLYKLPLYVDAYTGDEKVRFAVEITEPFQEFELEVAEEPALVIFDGEEQLLAELNHEKTEEELRFQYTNADHYISRYKALEALLEAGLMQPENRELFLAALEDSSYYIRRLALGAFDSYEGEGKKEVEQKVAELAEDEKSLVRADALSILSTLNPNAYREQFRKGLEDPSYSVMAAAIQGYSQTDATDKEKAFESLAEMKNADIHLALADFYILNKKKGKYEWFTEKLEEKQGSDLYYFLNYFGQYVSQLEEPYLQQGASILEEYARNGDVYYIRYSAFNALALLMDRLPGMVERLKEIAAAEEDPRLQEAYSRFLMN